MVGFVAIALGLALGDDLVANIGWAVSGVSLAIWTATIVLTRMLSPRIPFELMETED